MRVLVWPALIWAGLFLLYCVWRALAGISAGIGYVLGLAT